MPRKGRKDFFVETNTVGTENLLCVVLESECRKVIQFTTDMVYGKPQYIPVDTQHPQMPFGPYGQSKKFAESVCRKYRDKGIIIL